MVEGCHQTATHCSTTWNPPGRPRRIPVKPKLLAFAARTSWPSRAVPCPASRLYSREDFPPALSRVPRVGALLFCNVGQPNVVAEGQRPVPERKYAVTDSRPRARKRALSPRGVHRPRDPSAGESDVFLNPVEEVLDVPRQSARPVQAGVIGHTGRAPRTVGNRVHLQAVAVATPPIERLAREPQAVRKMRVQRSDKKLAESADADR